MALKTNDLDKIAEWQNKLEPDHLLAQFFASPPVGFSAEILENKLPKFSTKFDLLTTIDPKQRRQLQKLPLFRYWSRWFYFSTLFIGTTVSEFAPVPRSLNFQTAVSTLLRKADDYSLVIVKDIPQKSELLTREEIENAECFINSLQKHKFISVEGQALAYVPVDYHSIDDYLSRFSKSRRKDFRRKLTAMNHLQIEVLLAGDPLFFDDKAFQQIYSFYLQVYQQSEIHFDLLPEDFFRQLLRANDQSLRFITYRNLDGILIGYNICFVVGDMLVDKYIGFDYPSATEYNLYFVSWFYNLELARKACLKYYIAGWTDPKVKQYLGARFAVTRHAVYIRNRLLRWVLKKLQRFFEVDSQWASERGK